jgi:hypothetical protein
MRPTNEEHAQRQQQPSNCNGDEAGLCSPAIDDMAHRGRTDRDAPGQAGGTPRKRLRQPALVDRRLSDPNGCDQRWGNSHAAEDEQRCNPNRVADKREGQQRHSEQSCAHSEAPSRRRMPRDRSGHCPGDERAE